jgi:hypothetical protein
VGDIAGAEHAGGEADQRIEHDEHDVEIVDEQQGPHLRPHEQQADG